MKARLRTFAGAAAATLLQACVTTYAPSPNEPMVTLRAVGIGRPQLCKDGKVYWAPEAPGDNNAVRVPAGQRLTVGAHISSAGYQVTHYCRPFLSFVPRDGQTYLMNSALDGAGRCVVELVREDAEARTGVALEPSVGRADCPPR